MHKEHGTLPWRISKSCRIVLIRVTSNARQHTIDGFALTPNGPAFQARLNAPPREGRANVALESLVATWLDVPKCNVTIVTGQKSRIKHVAVHGDTLRLQQRANETLAQFRHEERYLVEETKAWALGLSMVKQLRQMYAKTLQAT